MKLPDDMPDDIKQAFQRIIGETTRNPKKCVTGACDCQQVLALPPEGKSKLKLLLSDFDKIDRRDKILTHEHHALHVERQKIKDAFWEYVYETFGLQSSGDYHFTEDGKIMKIREEN